MMVEQAGFGSEASGDSYDSWDIEIMSECEVHFWGDW